MSKNKQKNLILVIFAIVSTIILVVLGYQAVLNGGKDNNAQASTQEPIHVSENLSPILWSDPTTWPGGVVPDDTTEVIIPKSQRVILDTSGEAKNIIVRGTLEVADTGNIDLSTGWLLVDGGAFKVGSSDTPFVNDFTLTIDDLDSAVDVSCGGMGHYDFGNYFVAAYGGSTEHGATQNSFCDSVGDADAVGKISVHAQDTQTEWTKLSATAEVGSQTISLLDTTGWEVGDKISLASTDYDFRQTEEKVIDSINGNEITLDSPLEYMHFGAITHGVDERGEVGNLTRNVTFRTAESVKNMRTTGINNLSQTSEQLRLKRLHIFVATSGKAYIDGVNIDNAGQEGQLGRYPIHWHHTGDITGQFIKNSVIQNSINKCISLHISNNGLVHNNVTHNNIGHCIYLEHDEDKVVRSEGNTISGNLALKTIRPSALQKVKGYDDSISSYWITHPNNTLVDNVAAGSGNLGNGYSAVADLGAGFWYQLLDVPMSNVPFPQFDRNTAHSNISSGFWLDGDDGDWYDTTEDLYINEYTGYKNRVSNFWWRSVSLDNQKKIFINDSNFADSLNGVYLASAGKLFYGYAVVDNSTFVGETENKGTVVDGYDEIIGLDGRTSPINILSASNRGGNTVRAAEIYDGYTEYKNSTFINFQSDSQRAAAVFGLPYNTPYMQHPATSSINNTLINSNATYLDPSFDEAGADNFVILDQDGTLTGTANSYIVGQNNLQRDPSCELKTDWNAYHCTDQHLAMLRIENAEDNIHFADGFNFTNRTDQETDAVNRVGPDFKKNNLELFANMQTNHWYDFDSYESLTNTDYISNVYDLDFELKHSNINDRWLGLTYPIPHYPESVTSVAGSSSNFVELFSQNAIESSQDSAYFYDYDEAKLYLKLWVRDTEADLDSQFWGTQNEIQVRSRPTLRSGESLSVTGRSVYPADIADKDELKYVCGFNNVSNGSAIIDPQNPSAFIFTAPIDFEGDALIDYQNCNEAGDIIDPSTIENVRVLAPNVRPQVSDIQLEVPADSAANTQAVVVTDDDANFDITVANSLEIVESTKYGSISIANGQILYTPNTGYIGADSAVIKACDVLGECDLGDIIIIVEAITEVTASGAVMEDSSNDGSVTGTLLLDVVNNTWAPESTLTNSITIDNIPLGLTAIITRISDSQASLGFSGQAQNHEALDSSVITITIDPIAFENQNAGNDQIIVFDDQEIVFENKVVDADSDGIADSDEDKGPNAGDANNDGVLDSIQANVQSFVSPISNKYIAFSSENSCGDVEKLAQVEGSSLATESESIDYPVGLTDFELECDEAGNKTTVEIIYYDTLDQSNLKYYKYADNAHVDITSKVNITQEQIGSEQVTKVVYEIEDGGELDNDGMVNGAILDPAGLGILVEAETENKNENENEVEKEKKPVTTELTRTGGSQIWWFGIVGMAVILAIALLKIKQ